MSAVHAYMDELRVRGEVRLNEPMSRHVSWRAGGVAARAFFPVDLADLQAFLPGVAREEPVYFAGLGSNLLVRDGGLPGTAIFTHWALREIELLPESRELRVQAGVAAPKVARFAALNDLVGAEFLAGIPGTIGGALAMNAGCYGGETWDLARKVVTIDRAGRMHERAPAEYRVGYRTVVQHNGLEEWFVAAVFGLQDGDGAESRAKVKELLARRIASQPLGLPNAGSVFRNPQGTYAARLIEECGLKGRAIGGAVISPKHANFIVNMGGASAADIESLIELAQAAVKEKFGIELEREVRIVGEKSDAEEVTRKK